MDLCDIPQNKRSSTCVCTSNVVLTRSFQRKSSWAWLDGISELFEPARTAAADAESCACAEAVM